MFQDHDIARNVLIQLRKSVEHPPPHGSVNAIGILQV